MPNIGHIKLNGNGVGTMPSKKPGLYANIHKKRKRIEAQKKRGAKKVERMRKPGSKGAPTAKAFKQAKKTVKKRK